MADDSITDTVGEKLAPAPKRLALNMKATPALRARIEAAAKESGLSIAQEVERRLIASFDYQDAADYLRIALSKGSEG